MRKPLPFLAMPPDEGGMFSQGIFFFSHGAETTCYVDKTAIRTAI
jgi:hypothetical protein